MESEESGQPAHEHGKREPIAAANIAWVLGVAAALCVAIKAFIVAGVSIEGALLILKSSNVADIIIGMLVANIQFTSFVILLFVWRSTCKLNGRDLEGMSMK